MPDFAELFAGNRSSLPIWYGISNRMLFPRLQPEEYLRLLARTSAHILQLREKDLEPVRIRRLAETGAQASHDLGKLFLVNSETEAAVQGGADGVHLAGGGNPAAARSLAASLGRADFVIGLSVHSMEGARFGEGEGADYVLLGPVFPPISKQGRPAIGLRRLAEACALLKIPVIALGGITPGNAGSVLEAGAAGLAGISWVNDEIRSFLERPAPAIRPEDRG